MISAGVEPYTEGQHRPPGIPRPRRTICSMAFTLFDTSGLDGPVGVSASDPPRPVEFHRRLAGYRATALAEDRHLAQDLGCDKVWLKLELRRFGLPSFKFLGASYASYLVLLRRLDIEEQSPSMDDLATRLSKQQQLRLVAATDGNHGRAVARFAALVGLSSKIYVPSPTAPARIEAIRGEGAEVVVNSVDYDEAVMRCAQEAGSHDVIVSDTSWPGYEDTPREVIEGYETIFAEIDDQIIRQSVRSPTSLVVPAGVGGLAAAGAQWISRQTPSRPSLVAVEPTTAACVTVAAIARRSVSLSHAQQSSMVGLNCGTASPVAMETLRSVLSATMTISDDEANDEVKRLAGIGHEVSESGAAGTAGLRAAFRFAPEAAAAVFGARPIVVVTEGVTDPIGFEHIVGRPPSPGPENELG